MNVCLGSLCDLFIFHVVPKKGDPRALISWISRFTTPFGISAQGAENSEGFHMHVHEIETRKSRLGLWSYSPVVFPIKSNFWDRALPSCSYHPVIIRNNVGNKLWIYIHACYLPSAYLLPLTILSFSSYVLGMPRHVCLEHPKQFEQLWDAVRDEKHTGYLWSNLLFKAEA